MHLVPLGIRRQSHIRLCLYLHSGGKTSQGKGIWVILSIKHDACAILLGYVLLSGNTSSFNGDALVLFRLFCIPSF